jgi:hypothetical protein
MRNKISFRLFLVSAFLFFLFINKAVVASNPYKVIALSGKISLKGKELSRNDIIETPDIATFQKEARFESQHDWIKLLNIKSNEIHRVHALETPVFASNFQKQHIPLAARSANPYKYFENDTSLIKSLSLFQVYPKTIKNKTFLNVYFTGSNVYWLWDNDTLKFSDKNYLFSETKYVTLKTTSGQSTPKLSSSDGQIVINRKEIEKLQSGSLNLIYHNDGKEEILVSGIKVVNIASEIAALKSSGLTVEEITEDIIRVYFSNDPGKPNYNLSVIIDQIRNIASSR